MGLGTKRDGCYGSERGDGFLRPGITVEDDDETVPPHFNEDFESDCYGRDDEEG